MWVVTTPIGDPNNPNQLSICVSKYDAVREACRLNGLPGCSAPEVVYISKKSLSEIIDVLIGDHFKAAPHLALWLHLFAEYGTPYAMKKFKEADERFWQYHYIRGKLPGKVGRDV